MFYPSPNLHTTPSTWKWKNLWYINHLHIPQPWETTASINIIYTIQNSINYSFWHRRLEHPGHATMQHTHKGVLSVLTLEKPPFFTCTCCIKAKFITQKKGHNTRPSWATVPNERFQMDFGFVRGNTILEDKYGKLITSKDGYTWYLLVLNKFIHYTWVLPLEKTSCLNNHHLP